MQREVAEAIVKTAGDESRVRLYEGYSGRFMYGRETTGVVTKDWPTFLAALSEASYEQGARQTLTDLLYTEMKKVRWDELGREIIVY